MIDNEAKIKVIGVGGGGGNVISSMAEEKIKNIEFVAVNTDTQALRKNKAPIKITIGEELTKGLGVGGDPEVGKSAALESSADIEGIVKDADMIFITAGMGGGTGTGAAPEIARIAREKNKDVLIVAVVTKPFAYEGDYKMELALAGIEELRKYSDSMIIIPNSKISETFSREAKASDAFMAVDNVLKYAIKGITDVIYTPGDMNVDFADIKAIMKNSGNALIGIGIAAGADRHINATGAAINSPLLENSNIQEASGVIVHISAGKEDFKMFEFEESVEFVRKKITNENVKLKFGKVYSEGKSGSDDQFIVTVIAAGLTSRKAKYHYPSKSESPKKNASVKDRQTENEPISDTPAYLRRKTRILN